MTAERNRMRVPEIRNYTQTAVPGGTEVRYEVRAAGACAWEPVAFVHPTAADPERRLACVVCGEGWPARTLSAGVCIPCRYGGTD
jgi:hypothetical protein